MIYHFESFTLDLERGALLGPDGEHKLRHQAYRLLVALVEHAPKILSHDQLLDLVWGKEHLSASSLKQAISEVRQALGDDPNRPTFIETVHRRGYRFIAPVSDADADNERTVLVPEPTILPGNTGTRPVALLGAVILALVVIGFVSILWLTGRTLPAVPARDSIAIIGFSLPQENSEFAWTAEFLGQTLANELIADASLRVVASTRVDDMKRELHLQTQDRYTPEEIQRIGRNLGVDFIAGGSLNPGGASSPAGLDLTITDALTGLPDVTIHRTAPPGDFFALTSGIGGELRAALRPAIPSWGQLPQSTPQPISDDSEVQRLFAMGVARLRLFDALASVNQLEKAGALDPQAPLVQWQLAQALLNSGDQSRAAAAADAAMALIKGLPREQQLAIEAFALETHHQWDDAIAKYKALQEFIPDAVDYSLRLVMTLIRAGRAEEALPVFSTLHQMTPEINGDPRIALTEAKALLQLSRYEDAETAASASITRATEVGASIVKASALRERAWARQKLGRVEQALVDLEKSQDLFATFGHRSGEAGALSGLAGIHLEMGRLDEARILFLEANRIFHEIGERRSVASVLYNLAVIRANSGDIEGARSAFIETLEIKKELNDVAGYANVYDALAQIDSALGDLTAAAGWLRSATQGARDSGNRLLEGRCIRTVGDLARKNENPTSARENYDDALELFRQIGNPQEEGRTLISLADLARDRDDLEAAVRYLEAAEALFRSGSLLAELATTLHTLGMIRINLGEKEQAKSELEEVLMLAQDLHDEELAHQIRQELDEE